jgi:hypothetical protein
MLAAPVVTQLSVLLEPEVMLAGLAVKEPIVGVEPGPEEKFDELQPASPTKDNRMSTFAQRPNP